LKLQQFDSTAPLMVDIQSEPVVVVATYYDRYRRPITGSDTWNLSVPASGVVSLCVPVVSSSHTILFEVSPFHRHSCWLSHAMTHAGRGGLVVKTGRLKLADQGINFSIETVCHLQVYAPAPHLRLLTAAREVPRLISDADKFCVFHINHCSIQLLARVVQLVQCSGWLSLLPCVGWWNEYQSYGWVIIQMAMGECLAYNSLLTDSELHL